MVTRTRRLPATSLRQTTPAHGCTRARICLEFNREWPQCLVALLFVAGALLPMVGCNPRSDDGLRRFQKATLSPCPLFSDDILRWEGLPACPFPPFIEMERPCAIEYYIKGDPKPRARRRLAFDDAGRLVAFSDSRDEDVVDSRRIYHEDQGNIWLSHHYANYCGQSTPRFLYTIQETWDKEERPVDIASEPFHWIIHYDYKPQLFQDIARVIVQDGMQPPYALELSPGGHVVGKQVGHAKSVTDVDVSNGYVQSARWNDASGDEYGRAKYTYEGHRLQSLRLDYPATPSQTYRFIYACHDEPACAPEGTDDEVITPVTPSAFSRDPKLLLFVPRDCSDQLEHGRQICGTVFRGKQGLSARCCQGDDEGVGIEIRNQFAGSHVVVLTLKLVDGRELTTDFCRNDAYYSVCRIDRKLLMDLPEGMVTIEMTTKSGQAIHVLIADADELRKAVQ